jgi:hypothetical protein
VSSGRKTPELAWRGGSPDDHVRALVEAIGTDFVFLAEREGDPDGDGLIDRLT